MNIRNRNELCGFAGQRLQNVPQLRIITLIFAAVVIGLSALSAFVNYMLGLQIGQSGGLSNLGTRSILSALQSMLPLIQTGVVMCMELGFTAAMLRIARGQYVSHNTLRLGFDRFFVLLRFTILESLIFSGMAIASAYAGVMIFLMSPLSSKAIDLLMPVVSQTTLLDSAVTIPDAVYDSVMEALIPAYVICGILFCIAAIPLMYRLRMSKYVLIDKPAFGAIRAMGESRAMMKHNCMDLLKLDLKLWWFYLASAAATVLCYGDQILPMLGIALPFSEDVAFFLFYGLYWAAQFAIFLFLLPRAEVTYALAYDAVRPQEKPRSGVVLGNIFQM